MKTLLAGSDSMEFGWLLMCWIPHVRYRAWHGDYDNVIIVCRAGFENLYADFATGFENYHIDGDTDMWRCNGKSIGVPQSIKEKYPGADILEPSVVIRNTKEKFFWYYG